MIWQVKGLGSFLAFQVGRGAGGDQSLSGGSSLSSEESWSCRGGASLPSSALDLIGSLFPACGDACGDVLGKDVFRWSDREDLLFKSGGVAGKMGGVGEVGVCGGESIQFGVSEVQDWS